MVTVMENICICLSSVEFLFCVNSGGRKKRVTNMQKYLLYYESLLCFNSEVGRKKLEREIGKR